MIPEIFELALSDFVPMDKNILRILFVVMLLSFISGVRFLHIYLRARSQFPGPPVKDFWTGNLDQTMADDVHEKVRHSNDAYNYFLTMEQWLQWNREYGHIFQTVSIFISSQSQLADFR